MERRARKEQAFVLCVLYRYAYRRTIRKFSARYVGVILRKDGSLQYLQYGSYTINAVSHHFFIQRYSEIMIVTSGLFYNIYVHHQHVGC
jgi:hypothetical protein